MTEKELNNFIQETSDDIKNYVFSPIYVNNSLDKLVNGKMKLCDQISQPNVSTETLIIKILKMLRHLFFYAQKKFKTGIYTVPFSLFKEVFCNLIILLIMENRKIKQKWFCMFGKEKYDVTKLNEIRFIEAVLWQIADISKLYAILKMIPENKPLQNDSKYFYRNCR